MSHSLTAMKNGANSRRTSLTLSPVSPNAGRLRTASRPFTRGAENPPPPNAKRPPGGPDSPFLTLQELTFKGDRSYLRELLSQGDVLISSHHLPSRRDKGKDTITWSRKDWIEAHDSLKLWQSEYQTRASTGSDYNQEYLNAITDENMATFAPFFAELYQVIALLAVFETVWNTLYHKPQLGFAGDIHPHEDKFRKLFADYSRTILTIGNSPNGKWMWFNEKENGYPTGRRVGVLLGDGFMVTLTRHGSGADRSRAVKDKVPFHGTYNQHQITGAEGTAAFIFESRPDPAKGVTFDQYVTALHSKLPRRDPRIRDRRFDWNQLGKAPTHFRISATELSAKMLRLVVASWEGHEKMNVEKLARKYADAGISTEHPSGTKPDDCVHCDICQHTLHTKDGDFTKEANVIKHLETDLHQRYQSKKYEGFIGVEAKDVMQYDGLKQNQIDSGFEKKTAAITKFNEAFAAETGCKVKVYVMPDPRLVRQYHFHAFCGVCEEYLLVATRANKTGRYGCSENKVRLLLEQHHRWHKFTEDGMLVRISRSERCNTEKRLKTMAKDKASGKKRSATKKTPAKKKSKIVGKHITERSKRSNRPARESTLDVEYVDKSDYADSDDEQKTPARSKRSNRPARASTLDVEYADKSDYADSDDEQKTPARSGTDVKFASDLIDTDDEDSIEGILNDTAAASLTRKNVRHATTTVAAQRVNAIAHTALKGPWKCPSCTFLNGTGTRKCLMCNVSRGACDGELEQMATSQNALFIAGASNKIARLPARSDE